MILFFLFSFLTASKRFCICRPDRPGEVCSLSEKCSHFDSDDQILLVDRKSKSVIINSETLNHLDTQSNNMHSTKDLLEIEVFGSSPSKPLLISFQGQFFFDKIKIFGGEWRQSVKIQGLNIERKTIMHINEIDVEFPDYNENENNNIIQLDKIKITKSRLRGCNGSPLNIKAKKVVGDSLSLSSDIFLGKIDCQQYMLTDEDKNITNQLSIIPAAQIIKNDKMSKRMARILRGFNGDYEKYKMLIEDDYDRELVDRSIQILDQTEASKNEPSVRQNSDISNISLDDFSYNFCLISKSRFDRAYKNAE